MLFKEATKEATLKDVIEFCKPLTKEEWQKVSKTIEAHQKNYRSIQDANNKLDEDLSKLEDHPADEDCLDDELEEFCKEGEDTDEDNNNN